MKQTVGAVTKGSKLVWILSLVGLTILLAGSVFGVDWANYFVKSNLLYPAIGKPVITLLAFILVLITGVNKLSKKDWLYLFLAFLCMLPTDILMSVVAVNPNIAVGDLTFMIGGVLSIISHILLIIRIAHGWKWLKDFRIKDIWLPLLIFGSAVIFMVLLWPEIKAVGHAAIAPAYTAFFCTTAWIAWENVRRKLYPKTNAWMVAIAATGWYMTEVIGEIFNLGLGNVSEIAFRLVWIFYGTNVVLWALSGYTWDKKNASN
jgi:hypothetical protein